MLFPLFLSEVSLESLTRRSFVITAVSPDGVVTVALPLLSTTTVAPELTASIAFLTASFQSLLMYLSYLPTYG